MQRSRALVCLAWIASVVVAAPAANPVATSSYDYIVVGAGTAGAALASRIAEDTSVSVLLIEAGDDTVKNNIFSYVPGADVIGVGWYPNDTVGFDWNYVTAPQAGAANRKMHYARGKGIGGTSNRNFMLFHRPTRDAFEYWTNATSSQPSPGWTWEDVYPYFTKSSVQAAPDNAKRGPQYTPRYNPAAFPEKDPKKAPLPSSFSNFVFEYDNTLQAAFTELGYPNASDFNSGTLNGVTFCPSTINVKNSHRSTSQYFVDNAQSNGLKNLVVVINSLATKVNFDSSKTAVSVSYKAKDGTIVTAGAKREVIISAGAFGSPQLLMLSGIGPAATLNKFGIPVIADLPGVGQNMQDHVFFSPAYEILPSIYQFGHEAQLLNLVIAGIQGFANSGSLTNPVSDFLGWQRLNDSFIASKPELAVLADYPDLWPHIEYIAAGGLVGDFHNLLIQNLEEANKNKFYYSLEATIVAPSSRGIVTLASRDPAVLPIIDPKWLTSKTDQTLAIEMYRKVRRIFNTTAFRNVRNNNVEFFPGYNYDTDAQILSVIQRSMQTLWHAACTCSMQPRENRGVLDPYLRVYGVKGLRVVDASSFPSLLPGHPQSVIYMLAERANDFLKLARGAPITTTPRSPPSGDPGLPYAGPN